MSKLASVIFAEPPKCTYDRALAYFLRAEQLEPGFYKRNALFLGQTYDRMGDKAAAKHWYEKAIAMANVTADDNSAHQEAQKLLGKL